jgi:hypothetical protein
MGTTPALGIPYVEPTDLLANYPVADKAQADRVERLLGDRESRTAWLTAASGWSIETNQLDKFYYGLRSFLIAFTRTGAAITVPANGDITNSTIGTHALVGIAGYGPISTWSTGRMNQLILFGSSLSMTWVTPGTNIATGEQFSACGFFIGGA